MVENQSLKLVIHSQLTPETTQLIKRVTDVTLTNELQPY